MNETAHELKTKYIRRQQFFLYEMEFYAQREEYRGGLGVHKLIRYTSEKGVIE